MEKILNLKNKEKIEVIMFGKLKKIKVFSPHNSNRFDNPQFELNDIELECLNKFIQNIKIENYLEQILNYCNSEYFNIGEKEITINDLENELDIHSIAIWINAPDNYPEIAFYGECNCDPEHGICIGFKNNEFIGIGAQDWIL